MDAASLALIPISSVSQGIRTAGLLYPWTDRCDRCDRQCEKGVLGRLSACSYGVNYYRIDSAFMVFGFLVNAGDARPAQAKAARLNPKSVVPIKHFEILVRHFTASMQRHNQEIATAKDIIINEYREKAMYRRDLLELLKPEIRKNLAFLHDYKQFVSRVKQNINVILEMRYPGSNLELQLQLASKQEAAIYWLSAMMSEKLKTAFLLLNPEQLEWQERSTFRLHGLVIKYARMYDAAYREKAVELIQAGYSEGNILANSAAFSIIPHTLIDNALKYSSRNSRVILRFSETTQTIEMSVTSFGPKIEPEEQDKIFEIFYRGRSAKLHEEEGAGFGLYLAQYVAMDLGSRIAVTQKPERKNGGGYETTFGIVLRRES